MSGYERLGVKAWGKEYCQKTIKGPRNSVTYSFPVEEATHLLLNGGILKVDLTQKQYNTRFLSKVGEDMDNGYANYICEKRTPIFNMYADLDILQQADEEDKIAQVLDDGSISPGLLLKQWLAEIQFVMLEIFSNSPEYKPKRKWMNLCGCQHADKCHHIFDRLSAVICMARPKRQVEKEGVFYSKIGVHVVWPFIQCEAPFAEHKIRKAWIQHFQKKFGLRPKHNIWEDIFDKSIYHQNGLRMVGSDKMEKCPSCKGRKSKTGVCDTGLCDGETGSYPENRVYRVVDVLDSYGNTSLTTLRMMTKNGPTEVEYSSIRSTSKKTTISSDTPMPTWFDPFFVLDEADVHKDRFQPTKIKKNMIRQQVETWAENKEGEELFYRTTNTTMMTKLDANDPCISVIQDWIRNENLPSRAILPEIYRHVDVVDVKRCVGKGDNPYYLVRIDSNFCMNVGREHSHNSVFFLINENGLYQKCFCVCDTTEGRVAGKCRDYKSQNYAMPDAVCKVLYPLIYQKNCLLDSCVNNIRNITDEETEELMPVLIATYDQLWEQYDSRRRAFELNKRLNGQKGETYGERFKSKRK
jgi:hypothetical protein